MKYYADEIVKQIIKDTMKYTMTISQSVPMDAEYYPNIEIPDSYGRLIDADELEKAVEKMVICDSYEYTIAHEMIKGLLEIAPTVLEASNE